jgi:hypothetical protein
LIGVCCLFHRAGFINRFWVGHGFRACGKSQGSYQGMPSGIPQFAERQAGFSRCWQRRNFDSSDSREGHDF